MPTGGSAIPTCEVTRIMQTDHHKPALGILRERAVPPVACLYMGSRMRRLIGFPMVATAVSVAQQPGVHPLSGRRLAEVMGYQGADWLDRRERADEEAPVQAITALGLKQGDVVAKIAGAGSGYITVRMASKVGPTGRVYAEDIQPEMIELLKQRLAKVGVTNVTPVLGSADDPKCRRYPWILRCSSTLTTNFRHRKRCSVTFTAPAVPDVSSSLNTARRIQAYPFGSSTR